MKRFELLDLHAARDHAAQGGQALHLMRGEWAGPMAKAIGAPACFCRADVIGHLFDQDQDRLVATAKRLGVRRVLVHRTGTSRQHVDLCGKPLRIALEESE